MMREFLQRFSKVFEGASSLFGTVLGVNETSFEDIKVSMSICQSDIDQRVSNVIAAEDAGDLNEREMRSEFTALSSYIWDQAEYVDSEMGRLDKPLDAVQEMQVADFYMQCMSEHHIAAETDYFFDNGNPLNAKAQKLKDRADASFAAGIQNLIENIAPEQRQAFRYKFDSTLGKDWRPKAKSMVLRMTDEKMAQVRQESTPA